MTSSSVHATIATLVHHLANLGFGEPEGSDLLTLMRIRLRNLRTFVFCARKFGNDVHLRSTMDGSLGPLLVRIENSVGRVEQEIHSFCLRGKDGEAVDSLASKISDLEQHVQPLEEEIDEWYVSFTKYERQSSSLTADEVVEIIDSILKNLEDFLSFTSIFYSQVLGEPMEALAEHMAFLKNFIRFATQGNVEHRQLEDLLTHIEDVAMTATHILLVCRGDVFDEDWCKETHSCISVLLQDIKPIDILVCEIYARELRSPAPTKKIDDDTTIIMKNFLDFLTFFLWETLQLDTEYVVSMKDQLQVLYEGLRFFRIVLNKQQSNSFDEKIWYDIGDVVCDAAVLICSFYQTLEEVDVGLQDVTNEEVDVDQTHEEVDGGLPDVTHEEVDVRLPDVLERITVIRAAAEEQVPLPSTSNFPSSNELCFVDFLLENLTELASCEAEPFRKSLVQIIPEELVFLRTFLGDIAELRYEQDELQALWDRVLEVAYRVEILIDHILVGDTWDSFSMLYDSIIEDMGSAKTQALKIFYSKIQDIKVKNASRTSSHVPSKSTPTMTNEVVGLCDEATSIINRITRGTKQLRIIAIVGMPGIGKTTLASKVYNDPSVRCRFSAFAWCPVSQVFSKKRVLLELLNYIDPGRYVGMTEPDLAEKLRRCLKGKRFLIFLDDVWTIEAWDSLRGSFPDDSIGSRIIITSRLHDVAPHAMLDEEPLFLHHLNKDESLELLQRKLFPGKRWPSELHDLGMQIAENCKGLPLTIVIVAGLLATREQEGWKEIVDGLSSGVVSSTEQCRNTLEQSYKHLPDYLKPCFLYFGAFPEDQEVSLRRLIRLWIAEGFVRESKSKSLEDAAEHYLKDLICRSLILVAKRSSMGGVKTCRIHDLLHDFCLRKAKDEHFLHFLKGRDELLAFDEPRNLRRLCIHSEPQHFKMSKLFCPRARSLLFFNHSGGSPWIDLSFITRIFKLLTVLDLEQIHMGSIFPCEIDFLVQLRYLAILGNFSVIPSSLGNLSKLETFILRPCFNTVSLPDILWDLHKLKYICIRNVYHVTGGILPTENLDNNKVLYELDSFSGAILSSRGSMEKQLRKFPNIRELKCILNQDEIKNADKVIVPGFLSRLESLHMSTEYGLQKLKSLEFILRDYGVQKCTSFEFILPANLKKLTLQGFRLPWTTISSIGKLPNLEVLKLLEAFTGGTWEMDTWEMEEGEFSKLRFLKLSGLNIVRWRASDDQFLCFQKLVLRGCDKLEEIPSCLKHIPTLEMIEVFNCSEATASLVKQIEEEQVEMGNSVLKVLIQSRADFCTSF